MLQLKTPLGIVTIIGKPRQQQGEKVERNTNNQISEAYKLKIASEKLRERLRTYDDPTDPDTTTYLRDLNPQDYRNRLQAQLAIYKTEENEQVERRVIENELDALVMREYNIAEHKRWIMTKIAKQYNISYHKVRDIVTKYA